MTKKNLKIYIFLITILFLITITFKNQNATEVLLYADDISYDKNKNLIAKGNAKIIYQNRIITSDLIISSIFNKTLFENIISFLKSKGFKFDDFDKIYKHSSIKDIFKKQYSTKFKKLLKEKL